MGSRGSGKRRGGERKVKREVEFWDCGRWRREKKTINMALKDDDFK